jgi:fluoroacetyl-CoA thioesterase
MSEVSFDKITPGLTGELRIKVTPINTAAHLGSGGIEVFATPSMVRLMERAAVAAVDHLLPAGYQTVGVHLDVAHLAATPMGMEVTARAELVSVEGRKLTFRVEARDTVELIGQGTHQRMIINAARFKEKVEAKRKA